MNLDIDVRFTDDGLVIGRGQVQITTVNDEFPLVTLAQLGLAAVPVVAGMVKYAQLEAAAQLKHQAEEKKEKELGEMIEPPATPTEVGRPEHEDK